MGFGYEFIMVYGNVLNINLLLNLDLVSLDISMLFIM